MDRKLILDINTVLDSRPKIVKEHKRVLQSNLRACFTGKDLVDYLLENYNPESLNREKLAELVNKELCNHNASFQLIYPINSAEPFKDKKDAYYRFIEDEYKELKKDAAILNLHGIDTSAYLHFYESSGSSGRPSVQTVNIYFAELRDTLAEIIKTFVLPDGYTIDYKSLLESEIFDNKLIPAVAKLAYIDLSPMIGNDKMITAFFLNVYNTLHIHALCARYFQTKNFNLKLLDRFDFYSKYKYNIGGSLFTLHDIEHGILRKNSSMGESATSTVATYVFGAKSSNKRFKETDPRFKYIIQNEIDPRIHFATHCAAVDSPKLRVFDFDQLDSQLDLASKEFCSLEETIYMGESKGKYTIYITELFKFYRNEFGKTDLNVAEYILNYAAETLKKTVMQEKMATIPKITVKYRPFNWTVNNKKENDQDTDAGSEDPAKDEKKDDFSEKEEEKDQDSEDKKIDKEEKKSVIRKKTNEAQELGHSQNQLIEPDHQADLEDTEKDW